MRLYREGQRGEKRAEQCLSLRALLRCATGLVPTAESRHEEDSAEQVSGHCREGWCSLCLERVVGAAIFAENGCEHAPPHGRDEDR